MKNQASRLCVQTSFWVLASALCVASLTGCGATGNFTQGLDTDTAVQGLHGTVHGGPNPVIGATVKLYATTTVAPTAGNNFGYGDTATVLGTTTTAAGTGDFSFTGDAASCPAGQQAYVVAAGGHTGSNGANTAAVLMAALGPCSALANTTPVLIDEPTTIAAAYALGQFMTVSGSGSSTVVNISAPANNNAVTASCTVVSNATTACKASGLAHAFLNAANLVNSGTGVANTTISTGSTIVATVPQTLINTLANSVEACVNSAGSTSSPCTTLMGYSAYATLNPNITTPPSNTLQALQYLAQYPVEAATPTATPAASTATTAFFNIGSSNGYYTPALTSAPLDFTIAINYVFEPTGSALAPWGVATDINDNVYVSLATTPTIYSLTSNGAQNWETATGTSAGCATTGTRCSVRPDTLGNVWYVDNSGLTKLSTAGVLGATFTTVDVLNSLTVDLGNNVWLSANAATGGAGASGAQPNPSDLEELPQGQTTSPLVDVSVGGVPLTGSTPIRGLTFDSAGNLWGASDSAGGSGFGVLLMISNNNSLTAPNFSFGTSSTNPLIIFAGGPNHDNTPMIDASGNMWLGADSQIDEVTSSGSETGGATNYGTAATELYGAADGSVGRFQIMDGDGKIVWDAAAGNQGFVSLYYPNATYDGQATAGDLGANVYLNPCFVAGSATTCGLVSDGGSVIMNAIRMSAVDDTGAIWSATSSGSNMTQILGPAAPSWGYAPYIPLAIQTNTSERPY